jgi:hypothetical protein
MNDSNANLSVQQLKKAVTLREKIDTLQAKLDEILGQSQVASKTTNGQRKMSAAGRARIAAAARRRWKKAKAEGRNRL